MDRFRREAATGARITHRNVVRVYDILTGKSYDREGVSTEVHVISMEFVDGPPSPANQSEVQNLPKALDYFRQICSGVAAAHEQGVVHRDLKPENIMLDRETNVLKVADFGLAYFVDRDERDAVWDTKTRMTMGTVAYMPPEQGRDAKRVVESGDVYSLGRMLYEMITGSLPDGSFSAASTIVRELPESMDRLIEKCLEPKPERRYQSAGELLEAFNACTAELEDDEPVAEEVPEDKMTGVPQRRRGGQQAAPVLRPPAGLSSCCSDIRCGRGGSAVARGLVLGAWLLGASAPSQRKVWLLDGLTSAALRRIPCSTVTQRRPAAMAARALSGSPGRRRCHTVAQSSLRWRSVMSSGSAR